jgi:hypothetical protein
MMDLNDLNVSITNMSSEDLEECIRQLRHNRTEPDIVEKVLAKTRKKKDDDLASKLLNSGVSMEDLMKMLGAAQ